MDAIDVVLKKLMDETTAADAAYQLAEISDPRALEGLIDALKSENFYIRNFAVMGLAAKGDSAAVPFLLKFLSDNDIAVRASTAFALGKLGCTECVPELSACLRDSLNVDANLCRQLIVALSDICGKNCAETIALGLKSRLPVVRGTTAEFLAQVGNSDDLTRLSKVLHVETDSQARKMIEEAIQELKRNIASGF